DLASLDGVRRWWILIGSSPALDAIDWHKQSADTQMAVLSGDPRIPLSALPRDAIRLGYLSIGEADPRREYWNEVRAAPFLVEPDPSWPENVRVDLRDPQWQAVLLDQEIPRLLAMGFDGLMLDTIDTAPYLQAKDGVRFGGMRDALRELLRAIHQKFPRAPLIANGTEALVDVAPFVDGFVVEGVFATYDFGRRLYRETTADERTWKLAKIDQALAVARRPVFTIEYADVGDAALSGWAAGEAERRGFRPYVTVKDLNMLP
ncbi:MAG: endo alpha-1,4 polygalactosaminidase, partial [Pseudomonadota bacterium]